MFINNSTRQQLAYGEGDAPEQHAHSKAMKLIKLLSILISDAAQFALALWVLLWWHIQNILWPSNCGFFLLHWLYKNKQSTNEMGLKITRFGKIICANISFNIGPFSVISNLRCICLPSKTSTINRKNWVVGELCPTPTNNTADIKWHGCLFGVLSTVAVKERKMLLTFLPDFRIKSSP